MIVLGFMVLYWVLWRLAGLYYLLKYIVRLDLEYVAPFLNIHPYGGLKQKCGGCLRAIYYVNAMSRVHSAGVRVESGDRSASPGVRIEMGLPVGGAMGPFGAFSDVPTGDSPPRCFGFVLCYFAFLRRSGWGKCWFP